MGEDLSPAGAVLQWPLRHDILLLPVGAPWICRLGGHFAPLGNPFLLFISFYFNFRNDDLSNIQLGSLADQVSKSDKVWPFTNIFLIRTIRGCAKVSGCAARSLESDNHLFLSSQSDNSSIKPLAFSSYYFSSSSSIACFRPVRLELEQIGGKMKHEPVAPLCKVNRFGTYRLVCSCFSWHTFGILKLLAKV